MKERPIVSNVPYEQAYTYSAVVRKKDDFFLVDSDMDLVEIFSNEQFKRFIDNEYWEVYEEEA